MPKSITLELASDTLLPESMAPKRHSPVRPSVPVDLTPQENLFCIEYLRDYRQGDAALRAGYKSPHTGAKLMKLKRVQERIALAMAERSARTGLSVEMLLDIQGSIVRGDPRNLFREDGSMKTPAEWSEDDARMIAGIKTRRVTEIDPETGKPVPTEVQEIKFVDRPRVNETMMKHYQMLNQKLDVNVNVNLADRMRKAMARTGREPKAIDVEYEEIVEEPELIEGASEDVVEPDADEDELRLEDML